MPKIKTHKATVKRFKITRNDKIIKRKCGQDHFNAKESGKVGTNSRESGVTTRSKRRDIGMADTEYNIIRQLMPYKN